MNTYLRMLKPTQLMTVVLMPITLTHAYYKQNTIVFLFWLLVFITSVIYHFKKFDYPRHERSSLLFYKFDIIAANLLNIVQVYDIYQHTQYTLYFATGWLIYIYALGIFIWGNLTNTLIFDTNELIAEQYHAMWHTLPFLVTNMYLFTYKTETIQPIIKLL